MVWELCPAIVLRLPQAFQQTRTRKWTCIQLTNKLLQAKQISKLPPLLNHLPHPSKIQVVALLEVFSTSSQIYVALIPYLFEFVWKPSVKALYSKKIIKKMKSNLDLLPNNFVIYHQLWMFQFTGSSSTKVSWSFLSGWSPSDLFKYSSDPSKKWGNETNIGLSIIQTNNILYRNIWKTCYRFH